MALVAQTNGRVRRACSRGSWRRRAERGGCGARGGVRGEREVIPGAPGGGGVHGVRVLLGNGTWP
eukprot:scaffold12582_cov126-Isochrysis_galbana.AAC.7